MSGRAHRSERDPFEDESDSIDDMEWPESGLDIDDEEFARSIAAGRKKRKKKDAA